MAYTARIGRELRIVPAIPMKVSNAVDEARVMRFGMSYEVCDVHVLCLFPRWFKSMSGSFRANKGRADVPLNYVSTEYDSAAALLRNSMRIERKSFHFSAVHPLRAFIPRLSRSGYSSSTASFLTVEDMGKFVVSFESAASCLKFDERGGKVPKLEGAGHFLL